MVIPHLLCDLIASILTSNGSNGDRSRFIAIGASFKIGGRKPILIITVVGT